MKHPNRSIALWAALSCLGALTCSGTVAAQGQPSYRNEVQKAQRTGPTTPVGPAPHVTAGPKAVSRTKQPVGTPHKASSFAPHPTKRRVFGAPIQPPIVSNPPQQKPKRK